MSLPKWVEGGGCKTHDGDCCNCCPSEKKLKQALTIAWEALENLHNQLDDQCCEEQPIACSLRDETKEAMRRIEEMGK